MLLAIDAGNTNIVFAVFDGDTIKGQWRCSTTVERTADELGVWLHHLFELSGVPRTAISGAIIATVVPAAEFSLKTLCRQYFNVEPMVVGTPNVDLKMKIIMDRPSEVGADRLVNAVAAHRLFGGPLVVLDFGTATTFDVVDGQGNYLGGVIAPGVNLSIKALHMAAAQLPMVAVEAPGNVVGKNTIEAMQSGVYWGYISMIEGLLMRIRHQQNEPAMKVVATGGLAPLFARAIDEIGHSHGDLTMMGLLMIYRQNLENDKAGHLA
ncbi:type III pantothenate kinase [Thalassospira sp. MCCC 1A01428]|uniref:type III pantothenate kinase n=1 Tax=unclassified Thalassospira TaxID=2648997 RepID=UPI000A1D6044|nr:type III pantothenate kinase [Thalassospira sp. MCCC 1A01428]OSQ42419.1 pantothenate kinase [Thalassospira sp. MCCC 1A01428]